MINTLLLAYVLQFEPVWLSPYKGIYEHVQISIKLVKDEQRFNLKLTWRF